MAEDAWKQKIAGDRMRVDREFAERIDDSPFSQQEWNVVMTAVDFEIEGEGESARLVADTSKVEQVLPQLDEMEGGMGAIGAPSGEESSGGLLDSVKGALGVGDDGGDKRLDAAVELAEEYTRRLQEHLEENGRWETIREAATQPSPE